MFVKYAGKQTIEDLDNASATTVRDDHESLLVVGASGQAAMIRAAGLNEAWGVKSGEMSQLMTWGSAQYERFVEFLAEIRTELAINIFPKKYWNLDKWI
jgi:pyruvate carboxylase